MKILFLASEMDPFVKSGGLGDIIGSLPKALYEKGVEVAVFIPKYNTISERLLENLSYVCSTTIFVGNVPRNASIYKIVRDNVNIYFVGNDHYFNRYGLYGFDDDIERFSFFNRSALCALEIIGFQPDVLHLNDWQTAISALYIKEKYKNYTFYNKIKTLFTIHNIQYQGVFPEHQYYTLGLGRQFWTHNSIEYYNTINLLKSGLIYADAISTVSPTYAREILQPEFAYGLDGVLKTRVKDTYGILNGIDYERLNFDASKALEPVETTDIHELKAIRKRELQKQFGLPERDVPIYAIVSRLAEQKGLDLINEYMLQQDAQFIILGTGDPRLEHLFNHYQQCHHDKFRAYIGFDVNLSYKIYAGADFFIMPSLFEPCGLGQIFAMNFGTVPIVRNTGGLADTVKHFSISNLEGNGFVFNDFVADALNWAIDESLRVYKNKQLMERVVENAYNSNFSWDKSADEYIELYNKLID